MFQILRRLIDYFQCLLSLVSPVINTKFAYWRIFKKPLNVNAPRTFKEKLCVLKIKRYIKDPLVIKCADKFAVREYIKEKGCEEVLIPLLGVYDNIRDIKWEELPKSFVLKWNFGCGYNIICRDKELFNVDETIITFDNWEREKSYLLFSEMHYSMAPKKVIIEQYLDSKNGHFPDDYKVYCFNGEPQVILYICNRGTDDLSAAFFDMDWNFVGSTGKACYKDFKHLPSAPTCLEQIINVSRNLSAPFEFVRMDYYVIDDLLYFGEMTFTPAGCMFVSECQVNGKSMGQLLDISRL